MKMTTRPCRDDNDYWRLRAFLRETYLLHGGRLLNWPVQRLDYWRWHISNLSEASNHPLESIFLWENTDGQLAGAVLCEDPGNAFLQTHPAERTRELDTAMIVQAEENLSRRQDGRRFMCIWVDAKDGRLTELLVQRGYKRGHLTEAQWRRDLSEPIESALNPGGYTIRSLGDQTELPARSWASWRGFHPDSPDEDYQGWEWYLNIQRCPLYRRDLDIVAVTSGGEIASFATFWYDDAIRCVIIEPVATVPEHTRRGLARACILEGLRRVTQMGARRAFVSGFSAGANALYASTLSPEHDESGDWVKTWD